MIWKYASFRSMLKLKSLCWTCDRRRFVVSLLKGRYICSRLSGPEWVSYLPFSWGPGNGKNTDPRSTDPAERWRQHPSVSDSQSFPEAQKLWEERGVSNTPLNGGGGKRTELSATGSYIYPTRHDPSLPPFHCLEWQREHRALWGAQQEDSVLHPCPNHCCAPKSQRWQTRVKSITLLLLNFMLGSQLLLLAAISRP